MMRTVAGIVCGVIVAVVAVFVVQWVGHQIFPAADIVDPGDREAMVRQIAELPIGALLFVPLSWFIGAFAGGVFALLIDRSRMLLVATVVAGFILVAAVSTLLAIPHPWWLAALGIIGIAVAPVLAIFASGRSPAADSE